jgi:hypothetical protein
MSRHRYNKDISDEDYIFMHTYCKVSQKHVLQAATDLDTIATNIVREGLKFHGMSTSGFFEDADNDVAQCLQRSTKASFVVQEAAPVVIHEAPRLQELAEAARNLPSIERRPSQNVETMSSTLYDATGPNFAVTNQYAGDGQILQPQWQRYGEPGWRQQQGSSGIALGSSMYNAPLGVAEQEGISAANGTGGFPAQEWLDELCGDEGFLGVINQ